jgi:uncharacterized protein GlcG (DUF336 family)
MQWFKRTRDLKPPRRLRPQASLNLEPLESRELLDAASSMVFVNKVYQDLLHRPADPTALTSLTAALVQGAISRATVVLAVENSAEFRINEVETLYSLLLHRPADPSGLNSFTAFLAAGASPEQAGAAIAGSPEYFATRSGGTNDGFLDALYGDLLHRTVDPGGRAAFDFALAAGATRTQVATVIYASMEYRQDLVQSFYLQFLHRSADIPGLNAFVAALQAGASDAQIIVGFLSSAEYAPGGDPPNSDPATLTAAEVGTLLQRAAAASASHDAIIAIVDRAGNPLGIRVESGVSPTLLANAALKTFAIDGALAEARTAAFFANDSGGGTPLTSRTIEDISQTTMTQREIMSNPDILDPNSPIRGPGFVAPIGIRGHFPPNVPFTPQVDLFAIEHTNRDSLLLPGLDGIKGTADDIHLTNRFNVPDAFVSANPKMNPPESYGLISGIFPAGQSRGIGTLPGGIPIFKKDAAGNNFLVGGIGVFFPGQTGFATEENSSLDVTFNPTKRDRSVEAEFMAFAAVGGAPGIGFGVGTLGGVAPLPEINFPAGPDSRIDLVGITLDIVGPGGPTQGPQFVAAFGATLGAGDPNDGANVPVDMGGDPLVNGSVVAEGWLVTPHDGTGLTAADVVRIVQQGIAQANLTRAAIRLPLESTARMVFAVSDRNGNVLGLYRMPDATVFSIDVAVAKSRNVAYYADPTQLQAIDQVPGVPPGTAMSNRTFRYLALPRFPEGIEGAPPGPFSILNDPGTNPQTGLQVGPPLPPAFYQSIQGHDAFFPDTNFHDPNNLANQNGIVFFPGAVPLYKDVTGRGQAVLVGGLGVSGDGVDQDDVVTFAASQGYTPPPNILTADQTFVRGVRLPYQKFDRNPQG